MFPKDQIVARNRFGSGGEHSIPKSERNENIRTSQVEEHCSLSETGSCF